jgi:hypothetical protein
MRPPAGQPAMLVVLLNTFRYSRYLLVPERNAIHLILHAEAQPRDMVQAYLQVRVCVCVCGSCVVLWEEGCWAASMAPGQRVAPHETHKSTRHIPTRTRKPTQACILRKCLKMGQPISGDNLPELRIVLHDTLLAAENLTPPFMRALARQGWQTEKIVVEAHRRRARW